MRRTLSCLAAAAAALTALIVPRPVMAGHCGPVEIYSGKIVAPPGSSGTIQGVNLNGACDGVGEGADLRVILPGSDAISVKYLRGVRAENLLLVLNGLGFQSRRVLMWPVGGSFQSKYVLIPGGPGATLGAGKITATVTGPGVNVTETYRTLLG